jgi:hypothetical protein
VVLAIVSVSQHGQKKSGRRGSRWLAAGIFLVLWGLITHGTSAGTGDEPHYQMITYSLAFDRDLDLTHDYEDSGNLSLFGRYEGGAHLQPGRDGRLRPVHDIGMPLLFAPYYAVAYLITGQVIAHVPPPWLARARLNFTVVLRHLLSFAMIGVTAAMAVRLLDIFSALSISSRRAFAWVLLMVLSPPILSHSFLFFTEIVSAFIALYVFMWLRAGGERLRPCQAEAKQSRGEAAASVRAGGGAPAPVKKSWAVRAGALLAGAATGYLMLVHARNVGLIAGLMIVVLLRARTWPDRGLLVAFLGGAAVMFAVRTGVTYHFWGTWVTTPHERFGAVDGLQPFVTESVTRLAGWLFDQEHGLLPYAPIYLLAPAGWLALWKRDRVLCTEISILVGAYVAVMTMPMLNAHGWRGGWTPAARFLVPVAPFLAILTFAAVAHLRRLPAIVMVIVGVQVCLDALLWQDPHLLWNDGIGTSALLTFVDRGSGWLSSYVPSIFAPLSSRTMALVAAAVVAWAVLTAWLRRRGEFSPDLTY